MNMTSAIFPKAGPAPSPQLRRQGRAGTPPASPVELRDAWVRVPPCLASRAAGAFMKLTAKDATRLVGVSSPVAGVAEVHEMKMEGDVMKMRALPGAGTCRPARKWNSSPAATT
jgi:copper(I)-binding protein